MNLSLYLLLTPPVDSEMSDRDSRALHRTPHRYPSMVLDPVRQSVEGGSARRQAIRRLTAAEARHPFRVCQLRFAAKVVFNALGFLFMTAGLLLFLQVAQVVIS